MDIHLSMLLRNPIGSIGQVEVEHIVVVQVVQVVEATAIPLLQVVQLILVQVEVVLKQANPLLLVVVEGLESLY
jgi:hypothetical protein